MRTKSIFPYFVMCLIFLALLSACNFGPTRAAENLAPNPSFEETEEGIVSDWHGNHNPQTFSWSDDIARSGRHSVCIRNLPAQTSADWLTFEFIPVTPGMTYTFSGYVKGDFDREVYILVFPIDADGNHMDGYSTMDISFNNADWTYAEVDLTVPPDAVSVELDLGTNNISETAATGMICYDDVSFRKKT